MKTIYKALSLTLILLMVVGIATCAQAGEPNSADEPMSVSEINEPMETLSATPEPSDAPAAQGTPEPAPPPEWTPDATPEPAPSPEPTPDATPELTPPPEPTPDATSEPTPDSAMMAESTQSPDPTMASTPDPSLAPDPTAASPKPSPTPTLAPTASPALSVGDAEEAQTGQDWKGVIPANDGGMPIPRLYQYDYTTVLCQYGGVPRSVSTSGCNVTCVAMVAAYLTDEEHSPEELFSWALESDLYHGNGLSLSDVSKVAASLGVSGKWIGCNGNAVVKALKDGKPVIAHMGPGLFTKHGHYIVLRGVTKNGKILVNDPNSEYRSTLAYPMDTILREARGSTPFMVCSVK